MLLCANFHLKIATLLLAISGAISMLPQVTKPTSDATPTEQLPQHIYGLLDKLSCCRRQPNASAKFSLLLAEFLIKRKPNELCAQKRNRLLQHKYSLISSHTYFTYANFQLHRENALCATHALWEATLLSSAAQNGRAEIGASCGKFELAGKAK